MSFPQAAAFLIGVADLVLGGLISNGFIFTMMVIEWAKCKRLGSSGQLLLSVALTNMCASAAVAAMWVITLYVSNSENNVWFQIIVSFTTLAVSFRLWLTAWLCVFYCIKIVNSSCSFIFWCKQRISWLIPRLLVGTLLVSIFTSSITGFSAVMYAKHSKEKGIGTNGTQGNGRIYIYRAVKLLFLITGDACPFVIVLLCSILSVASLCRHIHHMNDGESNFQSFQAKAHIKAVGTMVCLLFLNISLYVVQIINNSLDLMGGTIVLLPRSVMILYSPFQAVILVLANPKLKGVAIQILQRTSI